MGKIWGFWVFHGESMEGKFCVLKYPGHVQKLFNFGHDVLIFLPFGAILSFDKMGQIWGNQIFSRIDMEGMA